MHLLKTRNITDNIAGGLNHSHLRLQARIKSKLLFSRSPNETHLCPCNEATDLQGCVGTEAGGETTGNNRTTVGGEKKKGCRKKCKQLQPIFPAV